MPRSFFDSVAGSPVSGRRLLLVSPHFPPGSSAGTLRWQKLAGYAAERGWGLDVIAFDPGSLANPDPARLGDLPAGVRAFGVAERALLLERLLMGAWKLVRRWRSRSEESSGASPSASEPRAAKAEPGRLFEAYEIAVESLRDRKWLRAAAAVGRDLVEPGVHRVVVSCGPPHMAHEAARRVAERHDLPLVIDLRDPWSLYEPPAGASGTPLWVLVARRRERRVMERAQLVVMNTKPARDAMQRTYPALRDRITYVTNGFDDEPVPEPRHGERFLVLYAGSVYVDRDPTPLFRAVARVIEGEGLTPAQFGLEFVGNVASDLESISLESLAADAGIGDFVRTEPPCPRAELLERLAGAAVLVSLPQGFHMAVPSKIFEYMLFEAWLLALAPAHSATALHLRETGADVVDPNDVEAIEKVLRARYREYRSGRRARRLCETERLGRAFQANRLFEKIESCVAAGSR